MEISKSDRPVLTEEVRRNLRKRTQRVEGRATARNEELLIKQAELWLENYRQRFTILRKTILKTPLRQLLFMESELAFPFPLPYISFAETNEELQHVWCIVAISMPEELLVLREFRFTQNGYDFTPIEPARLRYTPFHHYADAPQLAHLLNLLETFVYEGTAYLLDGTELEHFQGVLDAKLKTEAAAPTTPEPTIFPRVKSKRTRSIGDLRAQIEGLPDSLPLRVYSAGNGDYHVPITYTPSEPTSEETEFRDEYPQGVFVID